MCSAGLSKHSNGTSVGRILRSTAPAVFPSLYADTLYIHIYIYAKKPHLHAAAHIPPLKLALSLSLVSNDFSVAAAALLHSVTPSPVQRINCTHTHTHADERNSGREKLAQTAAAAQSREPRRGRLYAARRGRPRAPGTRPCGIPNGDAAAAAARGY